MKSKIWSRGGTLIECAVAMAVVLLGVIPAMIGVRQAVVASQQLDIEGALNDEVLRVSEILRVWPDNLIDRTFGTAETEENGEVEYTYTPVAGDGEDAGDQPELAPLPLGGFYAGVTADQNAITPVTLTFTLLRSSKGLSVGDPEAGGSALGTRVLDVINIAAAVEKDGRIYRSGGTVMRIRGNK